MLCLFYIHTTLSCTKQVPKNLNVKSEADRYLIKKIGMLSSMHFKIVNFFQINFISFGEQSINSFWCYKSSLLFLSNCVILHFLFVQTIDFIVYANNIFS